MPYYMKAYQLRQLRAFDGWTEPPRTGEPGAGEPSSDDDVVFLREDYVVSRSSIVGDGEVVFADVSDAWRDFCRDTLGFVVPDWAGESSNSPT
jgi:hypothetical protein